MRLEHEKRGAGDPVVLLHGIGHHGRGWRPVTARLARDYTVYAVDLPGFGRSVSLRGGPPTVPRLAAAVAAFMRTQGHERFRVAGTSLGGGLALELAKTEAAISACAISPIGFWNRPEQLWLNANLRGGQPLARAMLPALDSLVARAAVRRWSTRVLLAAHGDRVPPAELAADFRALAFAPAMVSTRRATMDAGFTEPEALRCPVTVAWGDRDLLLPYRTQSARARAVLPQATHVTLTGCGHIPVYDDPDQVAGVIREAFARTR